MEKITSRQNEKIKHLTSLCEEKYRKEYQEFVMEGILNLKMALASNMVKEIYSTKELNDIDISDDIKTYLVDDKVMDKISKEKNPSGIVFIARYLTYPNKKYKKILYLDDIQDPGNLGTIIRTSLALHIDVIYLSANSANIYNPKVLSSSRGAIFNIPVINMDFFDLIKTKDDKTKIISTSLGKNSVPLEKCPRFDSYILVLGNEGRGIKKEIIDSSDYVVNIPIDERIDSLNVAIASGILLYYFNN